MPIFAREKVGRVWPVDPREKTVEVFRFEGDGYALVGNHGLANAVSPPRLRR